MRDPYIYLCGTAFPKAMIIDMGAYADEEYLGEEFVPKPAKGCLWYLLGGWLGYVGYALTSVNDIRSVYGVTYKFVVMLSNGDMYECPYGRGCDLSVRDVKKMMKDYERHPEDYAIQAYTTS